MNEKEIKECDKNELISMLEKSGYEGTDVSLEISLFEYNVICRKKGDDYQIIIHYIPDKFTIEYQSENYFNSIVNENWFDKNGFFSFLGCSEIEWIKSNIANKVFDLLQYYGYQNIFGSVYQFMSIKELLQAEYLFN